MDPLLETIAQGGTVGLIVALTIAIVAFATRKVEPAGPSPREQAALDLAKAAIERTQESTAAVRELTHAFERVLDELRRRPA